MAAWPATVPPSAYSYALYYFSRRERRPYLDTLDRFSFSITLGIISIRVGNFFNSEIVGRVTDVPWGIKFPCYDSGLAVAEVPLRHPSQLYEALLGILTAIIIFTIDQRYGEQRPLGINVAIIFVVYFGGRFFLEFFKEYQAFAIGSSGLTMGQYLSLPLVAGGMLLLYRIHRDTGVA